MRLAYIAGPYTADTAAGVEENVQNALAVGRFAAVQGYAPIVPHLYLMMLVGSERGEGGHAVAKESRVQALRICRALALQCGRSGGVLFLMHNEDGSLSFGTQVDKEAFMIGFHQSRKRDRPMVLIHEFWPRDLAGLRQEESKS